MPDAFSKLRLAEGRNTSGEIDVPAWREDIEAEFEEWRKGACQRMGFAIAD